MLHNGGYLPTDKLDDIVPPWRNVDIRDPEDCGPPKRPHGRQLALTSRPHHPYIVEIIPSKPTVPNINTSPASPPPPMGPPTTPPEPRYLSEPPFMHNAPRSKRPTENQPLEHLDSHHMRPPPGWSTYVSSVYMEVFYYNASTGQSQWEFPSNHLLADSWEKKLSVDNIEYFVETGYHQYWHRQPRYRDDRSGHDPRTTPIEDNEHYQQWKTQYIHRELLNIMVIFPSIPPYAVAMLDRFGNAPSSKPLCLMSRRSDQDHLDYDIAHYIMRWVPAPRASRPTFRHLLHRLRQAVSDLPMTSPYTTANALP